MPEPLDIVVWTDEPFHASYLASVLDLEAPGLFRVRHVGRGEPPSVGRADLVLVQGGAAPEGAAPEGARVPAAHRMAAAFGAPVIVVSRGGMDLRALDRLMHEGADDVLDLAQLNASGLAAAVLKAVRRRWRSPDPPVADLAGLTGVAAVSRLGNAAVLDAIPEPAA